MDSVVKFRRQVRNFGLQIPEAESPTVKTEAEVQDSKTSGKIINLCNYQHQFFTYRVWPFICP